MDDELMVWFIDVGQGDGTFIKCPDGTTILVDYGSNKFKVDNSDIDALSFFTALPPGTIDDKKIDLLILTHPDTDHYNWLPAMIDDGFDFKEIAFSLRPNNYSGGKKLKNDNKKFNEWLEKKHENKSAEQLYFPSGRKDWKFFSLVKLHILCAGLKTDKDERNKNTASIVLMVEYEKWKIILTGDATYLTEVQIIANLKDSESSIYNLNLNCTCLKLGHHGSAKTSTSSNWAKLVRPQSVFISADRTGSHGEGGSTSHRHPSQAAIDTILQFGENRLKEFDVPHTYVAYRNKQTRDDKDFYGRSRNVETFNEKYDGDDKKDILVDKTLVNLNKQEIPYNSYYELGTKKAIFTSVFKMDFGIIDSGDKLGQRYDLGTTYELHFDKDKCQIVPWSDNFPSWATPKDTNRGGFLFENWTEEEYYYHIPKNVNEMDENETNADDETTSQDQSFSKRGKPNEIKNEEWNKHELPYVINK